MKKHFKLFSIAAAAVACLGIYSCAMENEMEPPADYSLSITPSEISEFSTEGGSVALAVRTKREWTATVTSTVPADDATWLAVTPAGIANSTIIVTVTTNRTTSKRAATIVVNNGSPENEATIFVSQAGVGD